MNHSVVAPRQACQHAEEQGQVQLIVSCADEGAALLREPQCCGPEAGMPARGAVCTELKARRASNNRHWPSHSAGIFQREQNEGQKTGLSSFFHAVRLRNARKRQETWHSSFFALRDGDATPQNKPTQGTQQLLLVTGLRHITGAMHAIRSEANTHY